MIQHGIIIIYCAYDMNYILQKCYGTYNSVFCPLIVLVLHFFVTNIISWLYENAGVLCNSAITCFL